MQRLKVAFRFLPFLIIIFLLLNVSVIEAKDVKVFKRGKVSLIDETQFKHPYEYEFTDDQDETDFDNAYDEKVPFLPKFVLHKNGFDQGYTRVPIVTRKGENTWSTPRPTTQRGEEYKTWGTPKILPITKPTPTRPDVTRTTPIPKTTFVAKAKFSLPPIKAEKPAKKPEVKATTPSEEEDAPVVTKLMKFFTRRPTTTTTESTTTAAATTVMPLKKKFFTRRPTTLSTEKSLEVTKSKERKPTTSASVEMITEDFTTDFTRKSFKKTKPTTTVSAEETFASTSRKQFTRKPTTTSASSEDPSTATSKKQFTRKPKPSSTEASTETSTEATTRKKFTRRPTSTEATTEASTEASTRRKFTRKPTSASSEDPSTFTSRKQFTRRPRPTSTEASTESSTEASTTKKKFTRRPPTSTTTTSSEEHPLRTKEFFTKRLPTTSSSASTEKSTEEATTKRKFTRRPKPTTTTTTEEPTTEEATTPLLPLKDRLRPMLTTREPTPTMPRRFRVFTNPAPAEAPSEELNPQQEIENQRKLKEKLSFGGGIFNQEFSSKHPAVVASINNGHGSVEQTVKSNAIVLQAQKNPFFLPSDVTPNPSLFSSSAATTSAPQVVHRWSSSWSSTWDSNGKVITSSTFSTFDTPETTTPTPSGSRSFTGTRTEPSTSTSSRTSSTRTSSSRRPVKPHVIHHGRQRYRGPTYNCRVLTPIEDGRPSINNDPTCPLKFPGFPADDSCRCRYDVEARDEHGCATGFLYTCKRVARS